MGVQFHSNSCFENIGAYLISACLREGKQNVSEWDNDQCRFRSATTTLTKHDTVLGILSIIVVSLKNIYSRQRRESRLCQVQNTTCYCAHLFCTPHFWHSTWRQTFAKSIQTVESEKDKEIEFNSRETILNLP